MVEKENVVILPTVRPKERMTKEELVEILSTEPVREYSDDYICIASRDLSGLDLSGMDLAYLKFAGCDLRGIRAVATKFGSSEFLLCDLSGADFTFASMEYASITGGCMDGANFSFSTLLHTEIGAESSEDVNFTGANLCFGLPFGEAGIGAIIDESVCSWIMYSLCVAMQNSGIPVSSCMAELANKAPQIKRHNLPTIEVTQ